jgi:hypothetical protein
MRPLFLGEHTLDLRYNSSMRNTQLEMTFL